MGSTLGGISSITEAAINGLEEVAQTSFDSHLV